MSQKTKNSLLIFILFLILTAAGGSYIYFFQKDKIKIKKAKLEKMRASYSSMEALQNKLNLAEVKVAKIDSALSERKFIIPSELTQEKFYEFVDNNFKDIPDFKYINIDYKGEFSENLIKYHKYNLEGVGYFESVYRLVYAIEHSKELKKIESGQIEGTTSVTKSGNARYLVKFEFEVKIYFAENDKFSSIVYAENIMSPRNLYDAFYPLIRDQIQANNSNLPDVQDAQLLFLYPDGAFIKDKKGNTFLLKEGDRVYLGYTTEINQKEQSISFILNKGGIVENYTLKVDSKTKGKK